MYRLPLPICAAVVIGFLGLSPGTAMAAEDCSTTAGLQPDLTPTDPLRDQSCNTVIVDAALSMKSTGELIGEAITRCGNLPNGPYRRIDGNANDKFFNTGDRRFDYVTLKTPANGAGDNSVLVSDGGNPATDVQLGFNPFFGTAGMLEISWEATSLGGGVTEFEIRDLSDPNQIVDSPGLEFVYLLKQGGNNQSATLICDPNMWFDEGLGDEYGIKVQVSHGVNTILVGWAAGPSGLQNQGNIATACGALNPDLAAGDPLPDNTDVTTIQEAFVSSIIGSYAQLFGNPLAPVDISSCILDPSGYARYCDLLEDPTVPNGCNPLGLIGGGPGAGVDQTTSTGGGGGGGVAAQSITTLSTTCTDTSTVYTTGGGSFGVGTSFNASLLCQ